MGKDNPAGEDFLFASPSDFDGDGALTREFLLRRGSCCQNSCRNCPYSSSSSGICPLCGKPN